MRKKQATNGPEAGRKMFSPEGKIVVASLSGGKDSVAMLILLVNRFGPDRVIAHYQVLAEDWEETLPYVQEVCQRLDIQLVAQQAVYEPTGDGRGVRRAAILDIHSPSDIVRWGSGVIAGTTDLALRRGWPPSAAARYCTSYFKRDLLDAWLVRNRQLGAEVIVALGERAAESPRRAGKPEFWPRLERQGWMAWNWLPVHRMSRREIFRLLHDYGFDPHPAYRAQGMTLRDMLDKDEEGGPRTACRFCVYATKSDVCHQVQAESNRDLLQRIIFVEQATGRTWWPNFPASQILVKSGVQDEMG